MQQAKVSDARNEQIAISREIVRKVIEFGVSQDQIVLIIHLLSHEIHDLEQMRELVGVTREMLRERKFLFVDSNE